MRFELCTCKLLEHTMNTFPDGFRALDICAALVEVLTENPRCGYVQGLHRHSDPAVDF